MSKVKKDLLKFAAKDGQFKRQVSQFRDVIGPDSKFTPEKGRYHLYVSYACPWAHRTLIARKLKGLESIVGLSVVHFHMDDKGWRFASPEECPGATLEPNYGFERLNQLYFKADPNYADRYTVPVLWDKKLGTIVNNESSEIIRIFNTAFNEFLDPEHAKLNFYPEELRPQIDSLNSWIYDGINNGVYKTGFTTKQEFYDKEVKNVFDNLDRVEKVLEQQHSKGSDFLVENVLTEADVRLYTTIIRFDPVYYFHFKCNIGSIRHDFPHLHRWVRNLYWNYPAFKDTTRFDHIKGHYYSSQIGVNPTGIVPAGPKPNILPLDA